MGGFCDDGLEGLPESVAVDLVGVPQGDSCLHRVDAVKGVWQHDPNHPGGADYVGALDRLEFLLNERVKAGESAGFGKIPILVPGYDAQGKASLEVLPQDVGEGSNGFLNVMRQNACGDLRQDKLVPLPLDGCPPNLFLLGLVKTLRTNGNQEYTDYAFKELSKLVLPAGQLTTFTAEQLADSATSRVAAWHKTGDCWELGLGPNTGCSYLTAISEGGTFDSITVCDAGTTKKLTAVEGQTIIGTAEGKWKLGAAYNPLWWGIRSAESHGTETGGQIALPSITVTLPALTGVFTRYMVRLDYSFDIFSSSTALHVLTVNGQICRVAGGSTGAGPALLPSTEWVGAGIVNNVDSVSTHTSLTGIIEAGDYVFSITRQGTISGNDDWAILSLSWFPIP